MTSSTNFFRGLAAAILSLLPFTPACAQTVFVGNAGNAADITTGRGSVGYTYAIGKYEVTLSQYTTFLNAVAASDPDDGESLYHPSMAPDLNIAGIARSGGPGSYTYQVIGDGNRPVTYVSIFDAMRFANWVNNGQPTGPQNASTTEDGAYTLIAGGTGLELHNPGAKVWIPTVDEWYKAAYFNPATTTYSQYPTQSNGAPGNVVGPGANLANYNNGVYSTTQSAAYDSNQNYLTPVGSFSGSGSYYGTFDQGGNVWEWNQSVDGVLDPGLRGGSWQDGTSTGLASDPGYTPPPGPYFADATSGFRLAAIPEPTTVITGLLCIWVAVLGWRKRHSKQAAIAA
jgi:formylglycine-generating enzyme required for sulfatase activity